MTKVVFVGDEPSRLNIDTHVPFVGAKCFQRLVQWINYIKPDYYVCLNSNTPEDIEKLLNLYHKGKFNVVALGNKASAKISKYGIGHRKLPHPSGLNRKINDQKYIEHQLDECLVWLRNNPYEQN